MRNFFKLKNQESQLGAAVVEFAILLPLLVILMAGAIEFGVLLYNKQVVTNASREGARAAINPLPETLSAQQITTIVEDYCDGKIITFGNPNKPSVIFTPSGQNFEDRNFDNTTYVTVQVNYSYGFLFPSILIRDPEKLTLNLTAQTTMKMM
jgi:Flp pilus assembly protein TadG